MTPEQQRAFDNTPAEQPKSRLEPHRELILRWRRQGRSYRRICSLLHDNFDLKVSYLALWEFVQRRSKPRKPKPEAETEQVTPEVAQPPLREQVAAPKPAANLSSMAVAQPRPSLASYRNKPALEPRPPVLQEFFYDEDKPLTIDRTIKD